MMKYSDYEKYEEIAFDYLLKRYGWKIFTSPKYALVDGVATHDNTITHVVEFKSRNMRYEQLTRMGTYLISHDKIVNGLKMSQMLCVPFILVVYLIDSDMVMGVQIGDEHGPTIDIDTAETYTQKSIEGGQVKRKNAFIGIDKFHIL